VSPPAVRRSAKAFLAGSLFALAHPGLRPVLAAQVPADTGAVISAITLERRNVFDQEESAKSWLLRLVNTLHVRTQPAIIRNEYLLRVGDRYDSLRAAETERNLMALGVFRGVSVDSVTSDSGVTLRVVTRDGWSTRPDFRFRSTGGSVVYTLALIEDNLLGTATHTELNYRKDPDRSSTILAFRKTRLIAGKVGADLVYTDRSDGRLLSGVLSWPFFANESRLGASLTFDTRRERVLGFRDGLEFARDTLQRRYVLGRVDVGRAFRASPLGYLRAGVVAQVRRDDFTDQTTADLVGIPTRTVTGAAGLFVEARRDHHAKVRGYQSFGVDEYIDLSGIVRLTALAAPKAFGYRADGIAPLLTAHTGVQFPGGFAYGDASAGGLYTSAGLDSGQVLLGGTAVFLPTPRHQVIVHAEWGMLALPVRGSEFDLGLGAGPRGFREHAFTGDREYFGTAEYRYTVTQDFLKVTGVGLAAFADHGGAWWQGEAHRSGWDAGVGLRFGPSRAPDQESSRIDLVRRFANDREPGGWVLVVGKGFVFSTGLRGGNR
jgi:hypothetical protein